MFDQDGYPDMPITPNVKNANQSGMDYSSQNQQQMDFAKYDPLAYEVRVTKPQPQPDPVPMVYYGAEDTPLPPGDSDFQPFGSFPPTQNQNQQNSQAPQDFFNITAAQPQAGLSKISSTTQNQPVQQTLPNDNPFISITNNQTNVFTNINQESNNNKANSDFNNINIFRSLGNEDSLDTKPSNNINIEQNMNNNVFGNSSDTSNAFNITSNAFTPVNDSNNNSGFPTTGFGAPVIVDPFAALSNVDKSQPVESLFGQKSNEPDPLAEKLEKEKHFGGSFGGIPIITGFGQNNDNTNQNSSNPITLDIFGSPNVQNNASPTDKSQTVDNIFALPQENSNPNDKNSFNVFGQPQNTSSPNDNPFAPPSTQTSPLNDVNKVKNDSFAPSDDYSPFGASNNDNENPFAINPPLNSHFQAEQKLQTSNNNKNVDKDNPFAISSPLPDPLSQNPTNPFAPPPSTHQQSFNTETQSSVDNPFAINTNIVKQSEENKQKTNVEESANPFTPVFNQSQAVSNPFAPPPPPPNTSDANFDPFGKNQQQSKDFNPFASQPSQSSINPGTNAKESSINLARSLFASDEPFTPSSLTPAQPPEIQKSESKPEPKIEANPFSIPIDSQNKETKLDEHENPPDFDPFGVGKALPVIEDASFTFDAEEEQKKKQEGMLDFSDFSKPSPSQIPQSKPSPDFDITNKSNNEPEKAIEVTEHNKENAKLTETHNPFENTPFGNNPFGQPQKEEVKTSSYNPYASSSTQNSFNPFGQTFSQTTVQNDAFTFDPASSTSGSNSNPFATNPSKLEQSNNETTENNNSENDQETDSDNGSSGDENDNNDELPQISFPAPVSNQIPQIDESDFLPVPNPTAEEESKKDSSKEPNQNDQPPSNPFAFTFPAQESQDSKDKQPSNPFETPKQGDSFAFPPPPSTSTPFSQFGQSSQAHAQQSGNQNPFSFTFPPPPEPSQQPKQENELNQQQPNNSSSNPFSFTFTPPPSENGSFPQPVQNPFDKQSSIDNPESEDDAKDVIGKHRKSNEDEVVSNSTPSTPRRIRSSPSDPFSKIVETASPYIEPRALPSQLQEVVENSPAARHESIIRVKIGSQFVEVPEDNDLYASFAAKDIKEGPFPPRQKTPLDEAFGELEPPEESTSSAQYEMKLPPPPQFVPFEQSQAVAILAAYCKTNLQDNSLSTIHEFLGIQDAAMCSIEELAV
ncbi:hypothetical protein TRFO_07998 [Tritrichomonas foetus]|uniref:Uncharacterized protein n=1 Tax=Tritrichomonas foetus TaxID=1144522 RepID=A0A1J4JNN8_9EUKA|nr:hypothetical protein TRFO_07998 [Tritrichomonas foetus]|eukprot:OHT00330.1 hypothetical protein TRFO_07998 [Tritrichomonas foetus]